MQDMAVAMIMRDRTTNIAVKYNVTYPMAELRVNHNVGSLYTERKQWMSMPRVPCNLYTASLNVIHSGPDHQDPVNE